MFFFSVHEKQYTVGTVKITPFITSACVRNMYDCVMKDRPRRTSDTPSRTPVRRTPLRNRSYLRLSCATLVHVVHAASAGVHQKKLE